MPDFKKHILVVDDTPTNLILMLKVLESLFRVTCKESAEECLQFMELDPPDLVLLDVRMPDIDGYECCRRIKAQEKFNHIPVVFLSGQTQIEDKLKGYEAGGSDYLTKPCDIKEIVVKIEHNLNIMSKYQRQVNKANAFASIAMSNSDELDVLLTFMQSSFKCSNPETLARLILDTLQTYNFNACVQLRGVHETLNLTLNGPCEPLEVTLMSDAIGDNKNFELGCRSLTSSQNMSLLVKNLPDNDERLCERLKDHMASILEGASARMDNLNVVYDNEQRMINRIKQAIFQVKDSLGNIEQITDKKHTGMADIIYNLNAKIHKSFTHLNLTVDQEDHFLELLNESMYEILNLSDNDDELKYQFRDIGSKLFDMTDNKIN